jgi:NAD(P)-dependent dehydrogenase (short-subunit alcohol dehydrogenase family)
MSGVGRADLRVGNAPYVTAKFAVTGLSEVMRPALAEHNIGVSVLCPGFTRADPGTSRPFRCRAPTGTETTCCRRTRSRRRRSRALRRTGCTSSRTARGRQEVIDRHHLLLQAFEAAALTSPPLRAPAPGPRS